MAPINRNFIVEHMNNGWIVLDPANNIIDLNAAAEKIIGIPAVQLIAQPAEKIFIHWPYLVNSLNETREINLKGSVKINDNLIYLSINISPLYDDQQQMSGKLITWWDNTAIRVEDETRQQARDAMFILLHSITSAASRALNLDDFLAESIYQIMYYSHSDSIAVYLLEDREKTSTTTNLVLVSQHGLPQNAAGKLMSIPESLEIVKWLFENGIPLLIPDTLKDDRISAQMKSLGSMSLLILPMMNENQMLGFISLTRTESPAYTLDEITKLGTVIEEVATFVQSNRQRQLSISLSERQRLVHDLHDSVTQKLYGLVRLAEATQAGIKAGKKNMPAQLIIQMTETARQALKEMRLFLFQMQPVDFKKEGLASILQYRLSAVEGRVDIDARLFADDNISLSPAKELAIYLIAQEALNNILKHAKAKKISVYLKNLNSGFILEVEDDGIGFDLLTTDQSGIGMKSMVERARNIGGIFEIISSPGKGTKVSVTLPLE